MTQEEYNKKLNELVKELTSVNILSIFVRKIASKIVKLYKEYHNE
jgi:hypothetical protein